MVCCSVLCIVSIYLSTFSHTLIHTFSLLWFSLGFLLLVALGIHFDILVLLSVRWLCFWYNSPLFFLFNVCDNRFSVTTIFDFPHWSNFIHFICWRSSILLYFHFMLSLYSLLTLHLVIVWVHYGTSNNICNKTNEKE